VAELHVLRVFTGAHGEGGNPLGVFLEAGALPDGRRQTVAAELGFSETVFVEDREQGRIRIHTPASELGFAGHPTVGSAWLLAAAGTPVESLRPPAGEVRVLGADREGARVAARPEWSPAFDYRRLDSEAEVDGLDPSAGGGATVYFWAWLDEPAGVVRARCFAPAEGIEEDEATGSASLALCARLDRPIEVHQGRGSLIRARPLGDGSVEIGGAVVLEERREHPLD
jgi:predicted PhzF superfamily epimerase YddE/YHI9